jgi:atypical dual specificity phosphatase
VSTRKDGYVHRFYWLIPGTLAGSSRPGANGGDLHEDLAFLRSQGIEAILSLTETPLDEWVLTEQGFSWQHLPIDDMTAPRPHQFMEALQFIDEQQAAGRATVVHCLAGQGRAGSMLAAWMIRSGISPADALAELRGVCPGAVENDEQEAALEAFARRRDWIV